MEGRLEKQERWRGEVEDEEKDVPRCAGDEDPGACYDGARVAYLRLER